jgi:hypothetical protein
MPAAHAGIGTIIHFAKRGYSYIKRIAAKVEITQGITYQLPLLGDGILPPIALQKITSLTLVVRIKPAGGKKQEAYKAESEKLKAKRGQTIGNQFLYHVN